MPLVTSIHQHKNGWSNFKWREPEETGQDFVETDLTGDGTWRELDLSSIIPADAKSVCMHVWFKDSTIVSFKFRKKGQAGEQQVLQCLNYVVNVYHAYQGFVAVDKDKIIEYYLSAPLDDAGITICGWTLE